MNSVSAQHPPCYIGFDNYNGYVDGSPGSVFGPDADLLEAKTSVEFANRTNAGQTGRAWVYADGVLKQSIGPFSMAPNSLTNITCSQAINLSPLLPYAPHAIEVYAEVKDAGGNVVGDGYEVIVFMVQPPGGGGGEGG